MMDHGKWLPFNGLTSPRNKAVMLVCCISIFSSFLKNFLVTIN